MGEDARGAETDGDPGREPGVCSGRLHPQAARGIDLFNRGEYFAAHEALEQAWREEPGPARELYRGVLQVAVIYYHLLRENNVGARKMIPRARGWLTQFPEVCRGIDVAALLADLDQVEERLERLGAQGLSSVHPQDFHPIRLVPKEK